MNNILGIGVGALIIGVLLGSFALPRMWPGVDYGDKIMAGNVDRHFIEEMIPHHEGAIAMAKLALEKSKRPEMLKLAAEIIKAQEQEIVDMRAWYEVWFGVTVPADSTGSMGGMGHGAGMHMGGMEGDLAALAAAADFDREFVRQMIPHHEMAVMMARMLAAGTSRSEMKQLAANIIASQSSEIVLMRGWLNN